MSSIVSSVKLFIPKKLIKKLELGILQQGGKLFLEEPRMICKQYSTDVWSKQFSNPDCALRMSAVRNGKDCMLNRRHLDSGYRPKPVPLPYRDLQPKASKCK